MVDSTNLLQWSRSSVVITVSSALVAPFEMSSVNSCVGGPGHCVGGPRHC